jgi:hypothetical protein
MGNSFFPLAIVVLIALLSLVIVPVIGGQIYNTERVMLPQSTVTEFGINGLQSMIEQAFSLFLNLFRTPTAPISPTNNSSPKNSSTLSSPLESPSLRYATWVTPAWIPIETQYSSPIQYAQATPAINYVQVIPSINYVQVTPIPQYTYPELPSALSDPSYSKVGSLDGSKSLVGPTLDTQFWVTGPTYSISDLPILPTQEKTISNPQTRYQSTTGADKIQSVSTIKVISTPQSIHTISSVSAGGTIKSVSVPIDAPTIKTNNPVSSSNTIHKVPTVVTVYNPPRVPTAASISIVNPPTIQRAIPVQPVIQPFGR